jgi:hypothetical protein
MPVTVRKSGSKFRVVEKATGAVAKNSAGTAADGGGHESEGKAKAQARAMNASMYGKKEGLKRLRKSAKSDS